MKVLIWSIALVLMSLTLFAQEPVAGQVDVIALVIEYLKSSLPAAALMVLMNPGALVVLGRIYIAVTPTKDDDQWLQKMESHPVWGAIFRLLASFSPVLRKDK